jgi:molecular chaperone GrpE
MPVTSQARSPGDLGTAGWPVRADDREPPVPAAPEGAPEPGPQGAAEGGPPPAADTVSPSTDQVPAEPDAGDTAEPPLAELSVAVRELAGAAERYHDRAAQREGVIDYLRSELETLRRGERRGMLRPLLTTMCRLRNDLMRQAETLPPDFGAEQAVELLISFADTVQFALEDNGVSSYRPEAGDPFDPRTHRRLRGAQTTDPDQAGRVAQALRDGYLDLDAGLPIVPAEVTVFMASKEST